MSDFNKEKAAFNEWYNGNTDDSWFFVNNANYFDKIKRILFGFYGGYHSRDEEITRLRAEIERKDEALYKIQKEVYDSVYWPEVNPIYKIAKQALQNNNR